MLDEIGRIDWSRKLSISRQQKQNKVIASFHFCATYFRGLELAAKRQQSKEATRRNRWLGILLQNEK